MIFKIFGDTFTTINQRMNIYPILLLDRPIKGKSKFLIDDGYEEKPQRGEIRVKTEAAGINFADVMSRRGLYGDAPEYPFTPGYEVVGIVNAVGEGVSETWLGKRVLAFTLFGGYAGVQYLLPEQCIEVPFEVDAALLTAFGTAYCTAYQALSMTQIKEGDKVLIHSAAGGVGYGLVELCKLRKVDITAVVSTEKKSLFLREKGIKTIIVSSDTSWYQETKLNDVKFDAIFNPVGGLHVKYGIRRLANGGTMVCYGASQRIKGLNKVGQIIADIRMLIGFGIYHPVPFIMRSQSLCGLNMLTLAKDRPHVIQSCLSAVIELYRLGKIEGPPSKTFPYTEVENAFRYIESRKSIGKMAIHFP
jgi:NADPH:quinone reductase-like Zn-dependent oxidoreductase